MSDSLIGKTVAGRYQVTELIGAGGQGSVYKAIHLTLNKTFALKILRDIEDERLKARFQQEAKIASHLEHKNIVAAIDHGYCPETNVLFIVMEYVSGISLKDLIKSNKDANQQITVDRFVNIAIQICDAMNYAHGEKGVIHCDLKPSNILITASATQSELVKITDFGIAKVLIESEELKRLTRTETWNPTGTYQYMAPEQFEAGYKPNFYSDVYSIGCVFFELLTGEVPYKADTIVQLINMHISAKIPDLDLQSVDPTVAVWLNNIILKSLSKDQMFRYHTVGELLADLRKLADHLNTIQENKGNSIDLAFKRFRLVVAQAIRQTISNIVITSTQKSKLKQTLVKAFAGFMLIVLGLAFAINVFANSYLSEFDRKILSHAIDVKPLVLKQTKPAKLDTSALIQLAFLGDEKLTTQLKTARDFRNEGNLNAAIIEYRDALNSANRLGLQKQEIGAQIMSEMALCYLFLGNTDAAKQTSEEALSVFKDIDYYDSIKSLLASSVLGRALFLQSNMDAAATEFKHTENTMRGADIKRRFDQVAYAQSFMADFYRAKGEFDLAENYYRAAIQSWAGFQGDGEYNEAAVLDQLSLLNLTKGKFVSAKENLGKAMTLIQTSFGKDNVARAKLAFHLSQIDWKQRDFLSAVSNTIEAKQLLSGR